MKTIFQVDVTRTYLLTVPEAIEVAMDAVKNNLPHAKQILSDSIEHWRYKIKADVTAERSIGIPIEMQPDQINFFEIVLTQKGGAL